MPAASQDSADWKQHWTADSTRIRKELDYRESVSLADALARTIEWERAIHQQKLIWPRLTTRQKMNI